MRRVKGNVFPDNIDDGAEIGGRGGGVDNGESGLNEGVNYKVNTKERETVRFTEELKLVGSTAVGDEGWG